MIQVGKQVKQLRKQRGWTQSELALRTGVPQPRISELETGCTKIGREWTLERLACALEVEVSVLFRGSDVI